MVNRAGVEEIVAKARAEGRKGLMEYEAKKALEAYGITTTKTSLTKTADEAVKKAKEFGYPVVMKISSPEITHKSDAGGVKVGLKSPEEVKKSFMEIVENAKKYDPKATVQGVIVQEYAATGREVIVGMIKDPTFGATLMFGLGGVFVEVLKDVSFRVTPLTRRDAEEMVKEIKGYKVLEGFRGEPPADVNAIIDAIMKISQLSADFEKDFSEMDVNPIFVYAAGKGLKAVDARIILT